MNDNPEQRIKNEILSYLCSINGGFFYPIDSTGIYDPVKKTFRKKNSIFHVRGVSDILGLLRGRAIAIEVKSKVGIVSDYQKRFIERFNEAGGLAFVARSIADVKLHLADLATAYPNKAPKTIETTTLE